MPEPGYRELTDRENEAILGTLTHETWLGLSVEDVASEWYRLDVDLRYLATAPNPADRLVEVARFSSASIKGEGRKDLTAAVVGSPQQQTSLSVGVANLPPGAIQPPLDATKRRGW